MTENNPFDFDDIYPNYDDYDDYEDEDENDYNHPNFKKDEQKAVQWAKNFLQKDFVILDTETTGLGNDDEIVEIAIISKYGSTILDTLIKPSKPIPPEVTAIHGITNEMVENAPSFNEVWQEIIPKINGKRVLIYNADFDARMIEQSSQNKDQCLNFSYECLMKWYAQFYGNWSSWHDNYKWQKLPPYILTDYRELKPHRALHNCLASLQLLHEMANYKEEKPSEKPVLFPPLQYGCVWKKMIEINIWHNHYWRTILTLSYPKFHKLTQLPTHLLPEDYDNF